VYGRETEPSDPGTVVDPQVWQNIWEFGSNPCVRAAITAQLYRYVQSSECQEIRDRSYVPTRGSTWLTPDCHNNAQDAQSRLALPNPPEYRIGPIWALDVVFDGISLRAAPRRFGQPGGGWELTTTRRIPFGERHRLT